VSITGFGQDGPLAHRAGYDYIIQGMSGLMDITGDPDSPPQKVGVAVVDLFTGVYASTALLAALRQRDMSGQGCYIDMSLLDVGVGILANQAMNYLSSGISPTRLGNAHPNIAPYQVFAVKDGHMIVAVGNDQQFVKLCEVLEVSHIAHHALFQTNAARVANRHELEAALSPYFITKTRLEWLHALEAAQIPAGPINAIEDVFKDPQVIHRGLRLELEGVPSVASPFVFDGQRLSAKGKSPDLGSGSMAWTKPKP
jgi:crotonobetainyl-CoA:carnitine CoA-transferase CaiB-like acyl-CoA transferase